MTTTSAAAVATYREEYEYVQKLQAELPKFVSKEHILNELLPAIALVTVIISLVYFASIHVVQSFLHLKTPNCYKPAYQLTNLIVNASFGIVGIYYFCQQSSSPTLDDLFVGDYSLYPLGCAQFGYNLWAIPVGILFVRESPTMIGHHVSVLFVAFMALFLPLGYRYFAPFMFGILELSSVPLAIMNVWKDHPEYIRKYPTVYLTIRLLFLTTFLYIRWFLYLPIKFDYLRLSGMGIMTYNSWAFAAYASLVWLASFFLCLLQIWWGFLILKSGLRVVMPRKKQMKVA